MGLTFVNHLPDVAKQLSGDISGAVDTALQQLGTDAAAHAPHATGALAASVYRITPQADTYADAVAALRATNPAAQASPKPSLTATEAALGFAAAYAAPVHDGHHTQSGTFVPARPFLATAIQDAAAQLEAATGKAVSKRLDGLAV